MSDLILMTLTFYVVANTIVWTYIMASIMAKHYPLLDEAKYESVKVKHILMVVLFFPAVFISVVMVAAFKSYQIILRKSVLFFRENKLMNKSLFKGLKKREWKK
jgi:hypothetical protein